MGDVLSTHLDDARRQHIAGESRAAQRAQGVRRGAPGHAPIPASLLGSRESQAPGRAGVAGGPRVLSKRVSSTSERPFSAPSEAALPPPGGTRTPTHPLEPGLVGSPNTLPQSSYGRGRSLLLTLGIPARKRSRPTRPACPDLP